MECEKCGQEHNLQFWLIANVLLNGKTEIDTAWGKKRVCGLTSMMETTANAVEAAKKSNKVQVIACNTTVGKQAALRALQAIVDFWRDQDRVSFSSGLCTDALAALAESKTEAPVEPKDQELMEALRAENSKLKAEKAQLRMTNASLRGAIREAQKMLNAIGSDKE